MIKLRPMNNNLVESIGAGRGGFCGIIRVRFFELSPVHTDITKDCQLAE